VATGRPSDVDLASRVARLTAGQRECLFLVDDHATSKEIARQLGISRHTVDARLRGAIQTLGVSSRREAAIIYRAAMQAEGYQPFAYQSPRIVTELREADIPAHEDATDTDESGAAEGAAEGAEQPLREPCPGVDAVLDGPVHLFQPGSLPRAGADTGIVSDSAVWTAVPAMDYSVRRPFLRLWGGANDLSAPQRLAGILIVTILAMLAFGMFLTGIEALTLLRS
jgi:DNA-binding CsgD family transcriptional regulator